MSKPLLSLLIPITPDRIEVVRPLLKVLDAERMNDVILDSMTVHGDTWVAKDEYIYEDGFHREIIMYCDNKQLTIGEKRENLYKRANGEYSIQIDSDDLIAEDAIRLILEGIKKHPGVDCVTYLENCIMNGEYKSSNHSLVYEKWQDNFDGYDYVRCPFYKDVIRTDIAKSVPFPKIRYGEDEQWSMALRPHLKTEYHIDRELYYYFYAPKDTHEERYGFNRNA